MSHFTVLVVGGNPEKQLAPYQENNMEDCPSEYLKFNDTEDKSLAEYKKESVEQVQMPDGRFLYPSDEEFRKKGAFGVGTDTHEVPSHLKIVKVKFNKLYLTFEEFMKEWHGYKSRDKKTNRYGYWENPNRKWDWYTLGGRWTGFFKLRPQAVGSVGRPGLMTPPADQGYADQARKSEIDFVVMRLEARARAAENYERLSRLMGGKILPLKYTWSEMLGKKKYKVLDIEEKRTLYHAQESLKKIQSVQLHSGTSKEDQDFLCWLEYEPYTVGREKYLQKAEDSAVCTFAVVMNGKWYERGSMGWWGCVSAAKPNQEWESEFAKLLNSASDNTLLSVYDCHI